MPQSRTRAHSIPGTSSRALFGDRLSVAPPGGNEQALLHSSQTSLESTSTTSHWKLLPTQSFRQHHNSVATPSHRSDSEQLQPSAISRPRTIVRKSLRLPPPVPEKDTPASMKGKHDDPHSDDEGTLVSGGDIAPQYHDELKKQVLEKEIVLEKPPSSSRISRKILAVIPGMSDDEEQDTKQSSIKQKRFSQLPRRPNSVHWGLRSSPYQPEFIIEEDEPVAERFTSLSPPTFHGRKKGAFISRR